MLYAEKLKDPRWQQKRLKIFERDQWTCVLCGDKESTLHVHHEIYNGEPWDAPEEYLKTHCEICHSVIECIKPRITDYKQFSIIKIFKRITKDDQSSIQAIAKTIGESTYCIFFCEFDNRTRKSKILEFIPVSVLKTLASFFYEVKLKPDCDHG